jgi:hypothetical protein
MLPNMALGQDKETHMKKILAALAASVALVAGTTGLASAEDYPASVPTKPVAAPTKVVDAGKTIKLTVKIGSGNSKPGGYLRVVFNGKKYTFRVVNGVAVFKGKAPKIKGTKTLKYTYKPYKGSVYKASKGTTKIVIG